MWVFHLVYSTTLTETLTVSLDPLGMGKRHLMRAEAKAAIAEMNNIKPSLSSNLQINKHLVSQFQTSIPTRHESRFNLGDGITGNASTGLQQGQESRYHW